ncbi:hypothetical protein J6836_00145 [Providencia sp. R33]|uniref:hypothetical protein n=1 Tax=Providencia TaxID=586 RepID=UPI001C5B94B4|nr:MULTISPECIES: hypothetical protein [Providencia]QXX82851.1 hypothetical protein J6836_00145 [Providencia sp. R33]
MIEIKVTFENHFGEDLIEVMLFRNLEFHIIHDIKDKEEKIDIATFYAIEGEKDENWYVQFLTASGEYWRSASFIDCSTTKEDDYKIILGVNGESKRVYAAFSSSSSCSAALKKL